MKAFNIRWDADPTIAQSLPKEIDIPRKVKIKGVDAISRYVSDQTGYSHMGFAIKYAPSELRQYEKRCRIANE